MMFIVRAQDDAAARRPSDLGIRIALTRRTPSLVADSDDGLIDLFCIGDEAAAERLQAAGCTIILLRDGWYQDDAGGGVTIWGQGAYWEIRDTPFTIKEASGPALEADADASGEALDVRRGIFGV